MLYGVWQESGLTITVRALLSLKGRRDIKPPLFSRVSGALPLPVDGLRCGPAPPNAPPAITQTPSGWR